MLKGIRKEFNKVFNVSEKEVDMKKEEALAQLSAAEMVVQLSAAQESLALQTAAFSELNSKFTEMSTKFAEAQEALLAVEAAKQELVAVAAAKQLAHRKESLEMAVGTEKATTLLSTLSVLDDASFDSVVSSMSSNLDKEATSQMFQETGVTAEAKAPEVVESKEMQIIKAKQASSAK